MKRNDIFTFTTPIEVEVTGVCLYPIFQGTAVTIYVCYAQNRVFTMLEESTMTDKGIEKTMKYHETIANHATLPDYDRMLENHQHQIDMANDYADKTL